MAQTMNPQFTTERRHIPDRRVHIASTHVSSARHMSAVDWIAMTFLILGGLNWGLIGLMDLNVVASVFGEGTALSRMIYALVGLSALYSVYTASKMSRARD